MEIAECRAGKAAETAVAGERMSEICCAIRGLEKSFGQNRVLRGIDLDLAAGQVTVLMGANGAGKSTLVRILCGQYRPGAGVMTLNGVDYAPADMADAIARGVVTVHQAIDDGVIPDLDVTMNLMLDRLTEPGARLFVRDRALRAEARRIAAGMGITTDVRTRVADLGVADRQMIAIARAMARAPKLLILDEPTSSLSAAEADRLFDLIDRLRGQGVAILYISHRMSDIRRLADRIVCMRDGEISATFDQHPLDTEGAVTAMLGHRVTEAAITPVTGGVPILRFERVVLREGAAPVDFGIDDGEVVAVTGLLGSGKTRLADILFGLARPIAGRVTLDGAAFAPSDPAEAIARGVFLSPKDRRGNAVIPDFDIDNNMTLPFLRNFGRLSFLSGRRQRTRAARMIDRIGIVCQSGRDGIGALSGGNQQKVMIARWLLEPCRALVLDEPFQGVDIGARRDIGHHIRATAPGRATLVLVSEIDEALEIADRVVVLSEGALAGMHVNRDIDPLALLAQISGSAPRRPMNGM